MQTETKIVFFDTYCPLCRNITKEETDEPCNECLTTPTNINSHKPINFDE